MNRDDLTLNKKFEPLSDPPVLPAVCERGLVKEFLDKVLPTTEAAAPALTGDLLACFGNMIGRSAHTKIGGEKHFGNLYVLIVGETSTGRKGTAWSTVQKLLDRADPKWARECIINSAPRTGPALVSVLRDPDGNDPGVSDKRLLIREAEFARLMEVVHQDGTLSGHLRTAWDGQDLQNLTKTNPQRATSPLISMVGDITPADFRRKARGVDVSNGVYNRMTFIFSEREKLLAFPPEPKGLGILASELSARAEYGRGLREVKLDPKAKKMYELFYRQTKSADWTRGLVGEFTARYAPQVLRFSLIYSLLSHDSGVINEDDLRAGIGFWQYSLDSLSYILAGLGLIPALDSAAVSRPEPAQVPVSTPAEITSLGNFVAIEPSAALRNDANGTTAAAGVDGGGYWEKFL